MRAENFVSDRDECLVWALPAPDPRLSANSPDPLVPAHGRVTRLARFRVFPSARQHIPPPAKQTPENLDLPSSWGGHRDGGGIRRLVGLLLRLHTGQHPQLLGDLRPLPVEHG